MPRSGPALGGWGQKEHRRRTTLLASAAPPRKRRPPLPWPLPEGTGGPAQPRGQDPLHVPLPPTRSALERDSEASEAPRAEEVQKLTDETLPAHVPGLQIQLLREPQGRGLLRELPRGWAGQPWAPAAPRLLAGTLPGGSHVVGYPQRKLRVCARAHARVSVCACPCVCVCLRVQGSGKQVLVAVAHVSWC